MQDKSIELYGLLVKEESSYGAGATVAAATDGVQLAEEAVAEIGYLHNGDRSNPPGTGGNQKAAAPSGRFITFPWSTEYQGPGAAYSSSVFAMVHRMLKASGHSATLDATGGAEKYTYAPHALTTTATSLGGEGYARGQKVVLTNAYADLSFKAAAGHFGVFSGDMMALVSSITEVALPTITYPTTTPPKVEGMALAIGSYTGGIIREVEFKMGRGRGARANLNASGAHAGYWIGRRHPTLSVLVEAELFATTPFHSSTQLDPYALYNAGTSVALSFTLGSALYNKLTFTAAQAQLAGPPAEEADGSTAMWRLTFNLRTSSPTANDDYSWVTG